MQAAHPTQSAGNFRDPAMMGRDQVPLLCPTAKFQGLQWGGQRAELACPPRTGLSPGAELPSSACVLSDWGREFISPVTALRGTRSAPQPLGWPKST